MCLDREKSTINEHDHTVKCKYCGRLQIRVPVVFIAALKQTDEVAFQCAAPTVYIPCRYGSRAPVSTRSKEET